MSFIFKNKLKLLLNKQLLKAYSLPVQQLQEHGLKTICVTWNSHKENSNTTHQNDSSNVQKKLKDSSKITLIQNQNITVTGLEDAKNLAKRRSMHLVKVKDMDAKIQRPVYKLLTSAEMLQNEMVDMKKSDKSTAAQKKSEKSLSIGCRIADHDMQSRLKNISKWLSKQHEVRILIQGNSENDLGNCDKIFKAIEESVKTPAVIGKIVQKRTKGTIVKFNIVPVIAAGSESPPESAQ